MAAKQKEESTPLTIALEHVADEAVIKLSGRVDINTSPDFRKVARTLCSDRHCKHLTVDFSQVAFIDTSGIATLLEVLVMAKKQCTRLTLSGLSEKVRYLIDVNGLTEFFKLDCSEQERVHQ